jgi:hypothetical protein
MTTKKDVNNTVNKVKEVASKPAKIAKPVEQPQVKKVTNKQEAFASLQETFTDVDKKALRLDETLFVDNVNRFNELNDKFGAINKADGSSFDIDSSKKHLGCVRSPWIALNKNDIILSLSNKFFNSIDTIHTQFERGQKSFYKMPVLDKYKNVYTMTHEYGHILEYKLVKKRIDYSQIKLDKNDIYTYNKQLKDYEKLEKQYSNDIKDEIINIAKNNNPNFDLSKNLSGYGHTNAHEFFAEVFTNSQCGQPNELGKAMELWLAKEGY